MSAVTSTVFVTGGAGNLGRAVANAFAERGTNLVLVDVQREALEKVFGTDSERRLLAPTDLLDQAAVDATVKKALERFGRIDVLCNIAGGFRMGPALHETPQRDWDFLFDLNAKTVLHTSRAVVPAMVKAGGGKIINVGAYAALKGVAGMSAYVASKSAVIRITETMAAELREKNINVNCVLPTVIDTPENRTAMPKANPAKWVAPADLANVIAFLASDAARAVHGAAVPVTALS